MKKNIMILVSIALFLNLACEDMDYGLEEEMEEDFDKSEIVASDSKPLNYWTNEWFSEEGTGIQDCDPGYYVRGVKCSGKWCDNKQLLCSREGKPDISKTMKATDWFSEETTNGNVNNQMCEQIDDKLWVVRGMRCGGSNCDNIKLRCATFFQGDGMVGNGLHNDCKWSDEISEEVGMNVFIAPKGKVIVQAKCLGSYCDRMQFYHCTPYFIDLSN